MPRLPRSSSTDPDRKWKVPAGYSADGRKKIGLQDLLDCDDPAASFSRLSYRQLAELTCARIQGQRSFKIGVVGIGILGKARACDEVRRRTRVGRELVELERMTIMDSINRASRRRPGNRATRRIG